MLSIFCLQFTPSCPIGHIRFINILTWLKGFHYIWVVFRLCIRVSFGKRKTKETLKNLQFWRKASEPEYVRISNVAYSVSSKFFSLRRVIVSYSQSDLWDLTLSMRRVTGSPWIADFRCWAFPEVHRGRDSWSVLTKGGAASGDENVQYTVTTKTPDKKPVRALHYYDPAFRL